MAQTFIKIENDMRQTWKNIKRQLGKVKISSYASLLINNITIDDPKQITIHFNDYFVNIVSKLVSNLPQLTHNFQTYLPSPTLNSLYFQGTTLFEIKKLVNNIQPKNSFGTDEVPSSILQTTPDNVLFALTHVFNLSLINGDFISGFKTAKVVPIHKKGNVTNVSSYGPISLLYSMCKILEKLVYNRVISFLNKQNFFYKYQFGFRKNHSTLHAISLLTENITYDFEKKEQVLGISLDLSKAFDTIDHKILLAKLWHYGIRGVVNKWFDSYLNNRKQLVEVNGICSDTKIIEFGVPQGSISFTLLYLCK